MPFVAAVMTGQGAGAIATIQLAGDDAKCALEKILRRPDGGPLHPETGRFLLGQVVDGSEIIDQVTLGCEGHHVYAIHCHGNPIVVRRIANLLRRCGATIVPAEQLLARILADRGFRTTIEMEAQLALTTVRTIEGAELVVHQAREGLSQKVRQWQDSLTSASLARIAAEAEQILTDSEPARWIISGCTIALVGPPNTGKSTLFNALAGREKAIVTDVRGTTRDWVSAEIHIPPLAATVIDTAGLDEALAAEPGSLDAIAQRESMEVLGRVDLVLLVLDLTQPAAQVPAVLTAALTGKRTLTVLNKADLASPERRDPTAGPVALSAKIGTGLDALLEAIRSISGVTRVPLDRTVAFNDRQRRLLAKLSSVRSVPAAASAISELLERPLSV